jgi:hypothetical protein
MMNVYGQVDKARELIQAKARFAGLSDHDRIPNRNPDNA